MVKCPFCFIYLDVSHLPHGHVVRCPACSGSIRVASSRPTEIRHFILGGVALGVVVGVLATLSISWMSRPVAPTRPMDPIPGPPGLVENVRIKEPAVPDISFMGTRWGETALENQKQIREEFSDRLFTFKPAKPWLIAMENGGETTQAVLLYERALLSLYETFHNEFQTLRLPEPDRALTVIILRDRQSFDTYCGVHKGGPLPSTVTGFYEQSRRRTVTYREGFGPFDRMLHEGSHQLVHYYSTMPMRSFWFHEGFGGLFETFEKRGDERFTYIVVQPVVNRPRHFAALRSLADDDLRSYVSVRELMTMTVDSFQRWYERQTDASSRDRIANAWYAVSWGLVYFMMHSGNEAYRDVLVEFFTQETRGLGGRETFELILKGRSGKDIDDLQAEFVEFLRSLK